MSEDQTKIEMVIDSIRANQVNHDRMVILKEKQGNRVVSIWIGDFERFIIAGKIRGISPSKSSPYELMCTIINLLGGTVKEVIFNYLRNDMFYTAITISGTDGERVIDCLPSAALALAMTADVPIFMLESVLLKASLTMDEDINKTS